MGFVFDFLFCFVFKYLGFFFLLICSKSQILHSNRPDHGVNANPENPYGLIVLFVNLYKKNNKDPLKTFYILTVKG